MPGDRTLKNIERLLGYFLFVEREKHTAAVRKLFLIFSLTGYAMVHASSRLSLIAETRVHACVGPHGISGGKSGTGTRFSPSSLIFSRLFNSNMAVCAHISHALRPLI
jgi:hypothetical protein